MINFQINDIVDHLPRNGQPAKGRGKVTGVNKKYAQVNHLLAVTWYSNGRTTLQGCRTLQLVERAESLFEAGERIRYADGVLPYRDGVVVQRSYLGSKDILVKLDSDAYTSWVRPRFLTKLPPLENTAPFVVLDEAAPVDPKVYDSLSEKFRREPNLRKWEASYTKRVVEGLTWMRNFQEPHLPYHKNLTEAIDLLKGYWHDLHLPYEQRDAARAEVKRLHDVCTGFRTELSNQDDEIEKLQKLLATERHYNATLRETIANAQRALEHIS